MNSNLHNFGIVVLSIIISYILFIVASNSIAIDNNKSPIYESGIVISTNLDDHKIEVSLHNGEGPKVYVDDLGDYSLDDIQYGDNVSLELKNKKYVIISLDEDR